MIGEKKAGKLEETAQAVSFFKEIIMLIEGLIPTQQGLRQTISSMVKYVKCCGIWDQKALNDYTHGFSPLINLSMFPDKKIYIHDGHHRITATLLGGRDYLYTQEYTLQQWTYEQYLEINLDVGWVTPYDPRTHCRKSDFRQYKKRFWHYHQKKLFK